MSGWDAERGVFILDRNRKRLSASPANHSTSSARRTSTTSPRLKRVK
jgi:hypothetical protein